MPQTDVLAILNRLLAIHFRSLAMFLRGTSPWTKASDDQGRQVVHDIADDQLAMVKRLTEEILDRNGQVASTAFPIEFTDLHFLALDYLLKELVLYQQRDIESIEACADALAFDPSAHALALEALGAAKAHREALEELTAQPA